MTLDWSWFGSMSIKVYGIEFRSILVKSGDKIEWTSQQSSLGSLQLNYHNGSIIESHYWDDSIIITILKEECGIPWKDLFEWLYNHLSSFPLSIVLFLQSHCCLIAEWDQAVLCCSSPLKSDKPQDQIWLCILQSLWLSSVRSCAVVCEIFQLWADRIN